MNERIQELAEQAWNTTAVSPDFGHPVSFAEKFAELIVRECINVIGESRESRQTAMYYRHRIAEHFEIL